MANRHAGNIGDVWKHLALAGLLEREKPRTYWESHAGSFQYLVDPELHRVADAQEYVQRSAALHLLVGARYTTILREGLRGGNLKMIPGSPKIALRILGRRANYLFVDIDQGSLNSIAGAALGLRMTPQQCEIVQDDGVDAVLYHQPGLRTMCFLDPYNPLDDDIGSGTSIDAFNSLRVKGVIPVLWYPILKEGCSIRRAVHEELQPPFWWGEIHVDPSLASSSGLYGCGMAVSNVGSTTLAYLETLGQALAQVMSVHWQSGNV